VQTNRTTNPLPRYPRIALPLALLALASDATGFDRWLLDRFADGSAGFPARHAFWAEQVLHRGGIWLVACIASIALLVFVAALRPGRWRRFRRDAAYVLACIALTTAGASLLKKTTNVDCPWDMTRYGGDQPDLRLLDARPAGFERGHCFPGGHSAGGFSLIALAFVLASRRPRAARPALLAAFVTGAIYAGCQWLRGAHFPSHDLWSATLAWSVACALAPMLRERPQAWRGPLPETAALGLALLMLPGLVRADVYPPIREIAYEGNHTTQEKVMARELSIALGDPADPGAIERSRQAIQDLGLFRKVTVEQTPLEDGVRVLFRVREKWYLVPYPRLSANTDGQNAVGAELRWNNVFGLNHSLRTLVSSADRREEGRGRQLSYILNYRAPFVFDTPYTLSWSNSHATTPVSEEGLDYDESVDQVQLLLSRKFGVFGAASQGWSAGTGLMWRSQDTNGDEAPEPFGDAYAAVAELGYVNLRDRVYNEVGTRASARFEVADQNLGSDYSYTRLTAQMKRSLAVGDAPHRTFEMSAEGGMSNNGPPDKKRDFSLGGTNGLRGYERNSFGGDFYYLFGAHYLRPLYWDWLRLVVGCEAGNVYHDADDMNTQIRWSFDLGLRVRATRLVNFEFEVGLALPLDHDSLRTYVSRDEL
jgi:membrane-associated PAP2 superfamily phosphatase